MTEWALKRFYETATVEKEADGYVVRLDNRPIRTPGKQAMVMPSKDMARCVADEWLAQEGTIDPLSMPWTRSVNSAIDKVGPQRAEVIAYLGDYAGTDLICYRAEGPDELVRRQSAAWDPLLDLLSQRYDATLRVTSGVIPVEQADEVVRRLTHSMEVMSEFHLTGFHDLVTLSGSFAIALAAVDEWQSVDDLWEMSRLDETWQSEQWGVDDEAAEAADLKRQAFAHAFRFYRSA